MNRCVKCNRPCGRRMMCRKCSTKQLEESRRLISNGERWAAEVNKIRNAGTAS